MKCIICDSENESNSVEHIVSESFGNKEYVMQKGEVCDICNGRFSKFEQSALSNSVFVMERARFGVESKKGRTAKGKLDGLKIEGDKDFKKSFMTVQGLDKGNFKNFDPSTMIGQIHVSTFDKSEAATSKMLLKTGIEALYKSRRKIYKKYNFKELKDYLQTISNTDWPFVTTSHELGKSISIPRFTDKYDLSKIHCELTYLELDKDTLLFKFRYGVVTMIINLLNRNLDWIEEIGKLDSNIGLYPEHYNTKLKRKKGIEKKGSS